MQWHIVFSLKMMQSNCMFRLLTTIVLAIMLASPAKASVFPVSTEIQIGKIMHYLKNVPRGTLLTVGGERAFREASMFENIENLVIVDIADEIIQFNNINIKLLKTPKLAKYKYLRWDASFKEWKEFDASLSENDFTFWQKYVRNIEFYPLPEELNRYGHSKYFKQYERVLTSLMLYYPKHAAKFNNLPKVFLKNVEFHELGSPNHLTADFSWFATERKDKDSCVNTYINNPREAVDLGRIIDYKTGNYLFDDSLYGRLHGLAMSNKITIIKTDLRSDEDIQKLYNKVKSLGKLAVLDLDNLFYADYLGEEDYQKVVTKFLDLGYENSLLLAMWNYKQFACGQFSVYLGFTFENASNWQNTPFLHKFLESENTSAELLPLLDGKLLTGKEKLPNLL